MPAVVRRPPSPPRPTPQISWAFQQGEDDCIATAAGDGAAALLTVSRAGPIRLNVSVRSLPSKNRANVPLRFAGGAGNWQLTARPTAAREFAADLGSGDMALSRVLSLLSGGTLEVGSQRVAIVPAGSQGQQWFDCARRQIFLTSH